MNDPASLTVRFDEFICGWESVSYMATNPHAMTDADTIVGSIDSSNSSHGNEYVIADISADEAWLSMEADAAPTLRAWR
ncbi:hypothetical protein AArcMg_0060 [Natrarchaeobaculum sulfurireducens]|uniref:Uncharacterized protein n=2 Tax=Natrarchaeobaculum sulfurireducens TaxID=2044521 RepID=A0A346PA71_9EURY|nr:hypothetical protein AArc1_0062 [Natrarchaeobaculum sulfurireducens]AXR80093.1 hypothetical protein AArcMg_0060 [Natrarchaeobaculum sulfurireducens]